MRRTLALLLGTGAIALGVAACGSTSASSSSTPSTGAAAAATTGSATTSSASVAASSGGKASSTLAISAPKSGALMFNTTSLAAKAGTVTITFTNPSSEGHNFTLAQASGTVVGATPTFSGGSKALTVQLKAGKYTYYCSVPGHRQAGMQGTLTVS